MKKSCWEIAGQALLVCALAGTAWSAAFAAGPGGGTTTGASADLPAGPIDINPVRADNAAAKSSSEAVSMSPQTIPPEELVRKSWTIAAQLARDPWFDKAADANPRLVAAVCAHRRAATILAAHEHLAEIADADHLLCRRLTRWKTATEVLLRNADCDRVIQLDPQGMYWAIERRPSYARVLAGHVMFYKMVNDNPDLGRVIAQHMD